MTETWKAIDGFEDYMISSFGRVKSLKFGKEIILEQSENSGGYFCVYLYKNGERKNKQIHTLMYETFNDIKIPKGYMVHHIDFTTNNILENFQMMTKGDHTILHHTGLKHSERTKQLIRENHIGMLGLNHSEKTKKKQSKTRKEKFKNGELSIIGENNPNSILTEQKVIQIRIDLKEGILTQTEIAKMFNVKQNTISLIKLRKTWKHI